ncbi:zinc-binding dehydrogenase, partial [Streptomyces sp. NPDC057074]|uniref:zinc-dependent alcohol dehydrogenase n=1 Tax=Streptomyces sp. NPDC057074 TaxID=3346015 RepID=UPI00363C79D6
MRTLMVTGPGEVAFVEEPDPVCGPDDVLVRVKACGICGSDAFYVQIGGIPPRQGRTPLGHEAAGVVVEVGEKVSGLSVGDHVVVNPLGDPQGRIGNGGPTGALTELLRVSGADAGRALRVVPKDLPFEVAALNEPMAVAYHGVNRTAPKPGDQVVVFGAGPIGLGAVIGYKGRGAGHVIVVDILPERLEKALAVGADAVVNPAEEDVAARLLELHGPGGDATGKPRGGTHI